MGFNTTVLILNDALGDIEKDPDAGKKIVAGIHRMGGGGHKPITVPIGHHCNPVEIIESHHADMTSVVAVGANSGRQVALVCGWKFDSEVDRLKAIIRELRREIKELQAQKVDAVKDTCQ